MKGTPREAEFNEFKAEDLKQVAETLKEVYELLHRYHFEDDFMLASSSLDPVAFTKLHIAANLIKRVQIDALQQIKRLENKVEQ